MRSRALPLMRPMRLKRLRQRSEPMAIKSVTYAGLCSRNWPKLAGARSRLTPTIGPKRLPKKLKVFPASEPGPPELSRYATYRFDDRLSLEGAIRELRRLWPKARSAGIVRQTRPLNKRKIELLRHVCIATPHESWEDRRRSWNKARPPKERFADTKAMITACHDAEQSLLGDRLALRWFYQPIARVPNAALRKMQQLGDSDAIREGRRRQAAWLGQFGSGFEVVGKSKKGGKENG